MEARNMKLSGSWAIDERTEGLRSKQIAIHVPGFGMSLDPSMVQLMEEIGRFLCVGLDLHCTAG